MKFDDETRARLPFKVESALDLNAATVELKVDGTWHVAAWEDTATMVTTKDGPKWTRRARTEDYFAGPAASDAYSVNLTLGRHLTQVRVTSGSEQIVAAASPIDVS